MEFSDKINATKIGLNSVIRVLKLYIFEYDLKENLLNRYVFKHLETIYFSGRLNLIEKNLFSLFRELKTIYFSLINIKYFLHKNNGLEFLFNLTSIYNDNNRIQVVLGDITENYIAKMKAYDYPDEDFCLFSNVNRTNFLFILNIEKCTCTIWWLISDFIEQNPSLVQMNYNARTHIGYYCLLKTFIFIF